MRTSSARTARRHPRATGVVAAGVVAAAVVLGAAAPAAAERGSYGDPADAGASLNDLRRVTVTHHDGTLRVRVRVTDLRAVSDAGPASLAVWVDTERSERGPELRLTTGLQSGTDYQLVRTDAWRVVSAPLTCAHSVRLRFAKDVAVLRVSRGCLGDSVEARVAVRMDDQYDASHPVRDWLGARRSFTPWLDRG